MAGGPCTRCRPTLPDAFSYTENAIDWAPARELVHATPSQRPYAKYVGDGRTNIHGILTNGHPMAYENSLFYFRYEGEDLYKASGARIAGLASMPVPIQKLDLVDEYSDRRGRAWGHDIALTAEGRPRLVYTRRRAVRPAATRSGVRTTTA
jgi:hypothetical protein